MKRNQTSGFWISEKCLSDGDGGTFQAPKLGLLEKCDYSVYSWACQSSSVYASRHADISVMKAWSQTGSLLNSVQDFLAVLTEVAQPIFIKNIKYAKYTKYTIYKNYKI